jgi:hypothetical protein
LVWIRIGITIRIIVAVRIGIIREPEVSAYEYTRAAEMPESSATEVTPVETSGVGRTMEASTVSTAMSTASRV